MCSHTCTKTYIRIHAHLQQWVAISSLNPTTFEHKVNHQSNLAATVAFFMIPLLLAIIAALLFALLYK
jgi:hypothetical protein